MRTFFAVIVVLVLAAVSHAQKTVSFPTEDGGVVWADSYGAGEHGVVLAHGGRFNKGSWEKQAQALAAAGFRVLARLPRLRSVTRPRRRRPHECSVALGRFGCGALPAEER